MMLEMLEVACARVAMALITFAMPRYLYNIGPYMHLKKTHFDPSSAVPQTNRKDDGNQTPISAA